jgi:hypothetical protein
MIRLIFIIIVVIQILIATQVVWIRFSTVTNTLVWLDTGIGTLVWASPVGSAFLATLSSPSIFTHAEILIKKIVGQIILKVPRTIKI